MSKTEMTEIAEKELTPKEQDKLWRDSQEGKAGTDLLKKALSAYFPEHMIKGEKYLFINPEDRLTEWRYYSDGYDRRGNPVNPDVVMELKERVPDPKNPNKRILKREEITNRPVVRFLTNGGACKCYYDGFEKHRLFVALSKTEVDGIIMKKK